MQNDLFNGSWELNAPHETLDEIKAEMIDKAKSIPELANRFFVFSQGEPNATIAVVGESPATYVFGRKSGKLFAIDAGYWTSFYAAMGLVFGFLGV